MPNRTGGEELEIVILLAELLHVSAQLQYYDRCGFVVQFVIQQVYNKSNNKMEQGSFEKIVLPPTYCVWFCYLFNGICFHFHFHLCITGISVDMSILHCL